MLIAEQGSLCDKDIEVGIDTGPIANAGQVVITSCGCDGLLLLASLLFQQTIGGEVVLDLLERRSVAIRMFERSKADVVQLLMLPRNGKAVRGVVPCRRLSFALS